MDNALAGSGPDIETRRAITIPSRFLLGTICLILPSIALVGCGSTKGTSKPSGNSAGSHSRGISSVGLVTDVGRLHDRSFNDAAYQGMQAAARQYGIAGRVLQSQSQSSYVPNLGYFAQQGTGLTIAVGPLMAASVYQVASIYPKAKFAIVDAAPIDPHGKAVTLPNVADLFFKEQESGYLVGVIAGLMEKKRVGRATHDRVGYMGGSPIPQVTDYLAGYVSGVKRVDPAVTVLPAYSDSFTDEAGGRTIGQAQIGQGADILFQVAASSGLGYLGAAEQAGVYGIGVDTNQGYLGKYVIASAVKRVDVAVREIIDLARKGSFRGGSYRFGLANGATGFTVSGGTVPPSIVSTANSYARKIAAGQIIPPSGFSRRS